MVKAGGAQGPIGPQGPAGMDGTGGGGGGSSTFVGLTDTPNALGSIGQSLVVGAGPVLEFSKINHVTANPSTTGAALTGLVVDGTTFTNTHTAATPAVPAVERVPTPATAGLVFRSSNTPLPEWDTGTYRDAHVTSAAYNAGDSVLVGSEFHIASAAVTGGTVDGASWDKLTTNMDYLGAPTTGDTFENGEIIFDTGHYHMRVGGTGTALPSASPQAWITLSAGAESDAACQVKQYPVSVSNSNVQATTTNGAQPQTGDTPVWEVTFTPQALGSRVSIIMSMNLRAEDDGSTDEQVRYTYAVYNDADSFNQIGGVKYGALRIHGSDGVSVWDHQLSEHWTDAPGTIAETTYSFRLQRRRPEGSNTETTAEITFASAGRRRCWTGATRTSPAIPCSRPCRYGTKGSRRSTRQCGSTSSAPA